MTRPRALLPLAASLLVVLGVSSEAHADHCHPDHPVEYFVKPLRLRVGLSVEAATYATERYEGEYQGTSLDVSWKHKWVELRAAMPAYRIVRNGLPELGLGDVFADVRVPFMDTNSLSNLNTGIALAATFPSGDPERDLGMGHVMLMPALWLTWRGLAPFLQVQVAYGRALAAASEHAHHGGGPRPIVNPMNASEIEFFATAGTLLHPFVVVRGGIYGAVPIATEAGESRGALVLGSDLILRYAEFGLETHLPVAGDPFLAKVQMTVAARF
ncbi:hypothetical protein [Chondromyces apiculatus]|uniref:Transporter n=1 Tax=Chondromyces apiculatus DSM 436 TaxID=1192034 RepID=A0A017SUS5_9BACT|nr:hypothetical protein [Chondromyces apiculatus]EYF00724.1 Hypothetical protein CAP_0292 [Chondromyces apiculatus DSM 436]